MIQGPALQSMTEWLADHRAAWDPEGKRICGNCLHAKVYGAPDDPMVRCAAGHGTPRHQGTMLRLKNPGSFASAAKCSDFSSMDDD